MAWVWRRNWPVTATRSALELCIRLLHGLEKKGYLRASIQQRGKSRRKFYRITPVGKKALEAARTKVRELFSELIEEV